MECFFIFCIYLGHLHQPGTAAAYPGLASPPPKRHGRVFLPPYPHRRVFRYREGIFAALPALEGDLVPGGCFCPRRAILHNLTSNHTHNTNPSTLPRHFHPPLFFFHSPATVPPSQEPQSRRLQASKPQPGGSFRPRRAILHALTSRSRQNADTSALPRQFHPPKSHKTANFCTP